MADKIGMHVSQLKRYEAGASQPTIDVFRRIALALNVSADMLLFEPDERGPDERLKLQFEAVIEAIRDLMAPPAPAHKRPIGFVTPDDTSAKPKAAKVKR